MALSLLLCLAAAAPVRATGSITGKVTTADSPGEPIQGVNVSAYLSNGTFVNSAWNRPDGTYSITGLDPGSYKVFFDDYNGVLLDEWYLNKPNSAVADLVVVSDGVATPGIDASLAPEGSISGTVTAGGSAIADVIVSVYARIDDELLSWGWGTTAADGTYLITGLAAGAYFVEFSPWDYYLPEYFSGAYSLRRATQVEVTGGVETTGFDTDLKTAGRIEGNVTAADGGDLGGVVSVEIYSGTTELVETAYAEETNGYAYGTGDLPPGRYWVKFRAGNPAYAGEWFQHQRTMALSDAVVVAGGGATAGIDANLEPGGGLAGTVTAAGGGDLGGAVDVYAYDDLGAVAGQGYADAAGSYAYAIDGLWPGNYRLRFEPSADSGFIAEYHADRLDLPAADAEAVAAGYTTYVDAELQAGYGISGTVSAGDAGELGKVRVDVFDTDRNLVATTWTDAAHFHAYRTPALQPGSYFVQFVPEAPWWADPGAQYAAEFYDDHPSSAGADQVAVGADSDTVGIDAVLELGGAIAGAVSAFDGGDLGARVAVEIYAGDGDPVGTAYADAGAGYTYRSGGLRAGNYFLKFVPVPRYEPEYYNNALLIGSARPVGVSAGAVTDGIDVVFGDPVPETDPPTGTVAINADAAWTNSTAVTLTLEADDASLPIQMCVSNTASCSAWIAFATTKSWTLPFVNGTRTVNVWFRDALGNATAVETPFSDSIGLDTTAPTNEPVTATPGDTELTLDWSDFPDAGSGVAGYMAVFQTGGTAPSSCASGAQVPDYGGISTALVHAGLANGTTYSYRVCAFDAAGNVSSGATATGKPVPETDPPTGTVAINADAAWTNSTAVTLTLEADDASLPIQMCVSNTASCSAWTDFATTKSWTLTAGNGSGTVYVWFRDPWGNATPVETPFSDSIGLDTTAPTNEPVTATPGDMKLTLDWSDFPDVGSGVAGYTAVFQTGGTPPSSCASGAPVPDYGGISTTLVHTGLANGTTYSYRVCATDVAGNVSSGATATGRPVPVGGSTARTVMINADAAWTMSTAVTLTLEPDDVNPQIQMCISNTASCTSWKAFATTKTWTLTSGNGTKTVNVWFRDALGNTTPIGTPFFDTIGLDTAAPVNGTLTVTPGPGENVLAWDNFSDAVNGSGIDRYKVVYATGTAPASCAKGSVVYEGPDKTTTHTGLSNLTYGYRVCAIDVAGRVSSGVTKSGTPNRPEFDAPTGTVAINAGAAWTKSTAVTLTLEANDASPPIRMCISNTESCTSWTGFATTNTTKTWTLTSANGMKTVNVWFRDVWGNTTQVETPFSDTIGLDTAAPLNRTLTVVPGSGENALSWPGFSDGLIGSGISSYKVVFAIGTAPASCAAGIVVPDYDGISESYTHTGLVSGRTYAYRVCAVDKAGNVSSGATGTGKPTP